jgi:hypothetical protein
MMLSGCLTLTSEMLLLRLPDAREHERADAHIRLLHERERADAQTSQHLLRLQNAYRVPRTRTRASQQSRCCPRTRASQRCCRETSELSMSIQKQVSIFSGCPTREEAKEEGGLTLRSRWQTPCWWQYSTPDSICSHECIRQHLLSSPHPPTVSCCFPLHPCLMRQQTLALYPTRGKTHK